MFIHTWTSYHSVMWFVQKCRQYLLCKYPFTASVTVACVFLTTHRTANVNASFRPTYIQVRFCIRPAGLQHRQYIFILWNGLAYCKIVLWNRTCKCRFRGWNVLDSVGSTPNIFPGHSSAERSRRWWAFAGTQLQAVVEAIKLFFAV